MDPFVILTRPGPVVVTAIHAGHEVRPAVAAMMALEPQDRLREEDPFTERFIPSSVSAVVVTRSRFEVDMNRSRDAAVYLTPAAAWGLEVWRLPLPSDLAEESRTLHDRFREAVRVLLDEKVAAHGGFVVLDLHAYNHRRGGPTAQPEDSALNPEVNIGTGTLDRELWAPVVDSFAGTLGERGFDVRENVNFRGGDLCRWVNEEYDGVGCGLAVEFKKTFMDEWTGIPDESEITRISSAVTASVAGIADALMARISGRGE